MTDIHHAMFTAPAMAAAFSRDALVRRMLDFEVALAQSQAALGLIPAAAADAIAAAGRLDAFDLDALYREAAVSGTPAVPLVAMLTARLDADARRYVHWGATSQDAIDTALMLQMRDGIDLLVVRLLDVARCSADLAERHRSTLMAGRTLLQHAVPITFGLKAARWLATATRMVARLREARARLLVVQLGGAAGTLSALGRDGAHVTERLARALQLGGPDLPWHAERDRIGELGGLLGVLAAAMAKIAGDLALLSQTEVRELSSGAGRSSTMPQKRNPVEAMAAIACSKVAVGLAGATISSGAHEHERAVGGWQAEWDLMPQLFQRCSGVLEWLYRAIDGLDVDADRMRANLQLTNGLIMAEALTMALAAHLGRDDAYRLVGDLCEQTMRSGAHLADVAAADAAVVAVLPTEVLARVFETPRSLGSADLFIDRALAAYHRVRTESAGPATAP